MAKKVLIIVLVVLAIAIAVLFFVAAKNKKKKQTESNTNDNTGTSNETTTNTSSSNNSSSANTTTVSNVLVIEPTSFPLQLNSKGKAVKIIQALAGVTIDGIWGANTDNAVKSKLGVSKIEAADFVKFVVTPAATSTAFPLKSGSSNNFVKAVQILVGSNPDGMWGTNTATAVKAVLNKTQLTPDDFAYLVYNALKLPVVLTWKPTNAYNTPVVITDVSQLFSNAINF